MRLKLFFMLLLLGLTSFCFAANPVTKNEKPNAQDSNKKTAKDDKNYNVRFAWWELPTNIPDLYVLSGNKYISVAPRNMAMSPEIGLNCGEKLDLLRKLVSEEKDNTGHPKESYEVYTSINLAQLESRDLGILIFPNKQKNVAGTRVFDFSARGFPYGSFIAVNFTRSKINCTIDDSSFSIMPGGFNRLPKVFTERTAAHIGMVTSDNDKTENKIVSTKMILSQNIRTLYFIVPSPTSSSYDVRCIMDIDSTPSKAPETTDNTSEDTNSKNSKPKKGSP